MVGTKIWIVNKKNYCIFNIILFCLYGDKNIDTSIILQPHGIFQICIYNGFVVFA